jgi:hypothetical protein
MSLLDSSRTSLIQTIPTPPTKGSYSQVAKFPISYFTSSLYLYYVMYLKNRTLFFSRRINTKDSKEILNNINKEVQLDGFYQKTSAMRYFITFQCRFADKPTMM